MRSSLDSVKMDGDTRLISSERNMTDLAMLSGLQFLPHLSDNYGRIQSLPSLDSTGLMSMQSNFTQTFLKSILTSIDCKDSIVANAWLETLLDVIDLLPKEVVKEEILTLAVNKSQSQQIPSRIAACKIIGKISTKFEPYILTSEVVGVVQSLCQDVSGDVRGSMCAHLASVASGVGLNTTKTLILPEIVNLCSDEEADVRLAGINTVVQCISLVDKDTRTNTLIPLLTKFCERSQKAEDETLPVVAHLLGRMCHSLHDDMTPAQREWFLKLYCSLSTIGLPDVKKLHMEFSMPDLIIEVKRGDIEAECRHQCSFNLPAMVVFAGGFESYRQHLHEVLLSFVSDPSLFVRTTMALSFHQVCSQLGPEVGIVRETFLSILCSDNLEIVSAVAPKISHVLSVFNQHKVVSFTSEESEMLELVSALKGAESILCESSNWRMHSEVLRQAASLSFCISPEVLFSNMVPLMIHRMHTARPIPCREAAASTLLVYLRHMHTKEHVEHIRNTLVTEFCEGKSCHKRMLFINVCQMGLELLPHESFSAFFFDPLLALHADPVPNIRLKLVGLLPILKGILSNGELEQKLKDFETAVGSLLVRESDRDVCDAIGTVIKILEKITISSPSKDDSNKTAVASSQEEGVSNSDTQGSSTGDEKTESSSQGGSPRRSSGSGKIPVFVASDRRKSKLIAPEAPPDETTIEREFLNNQKASVDDANSQVDSKNSVSHSWAKRSQNSKDDSDLPSLPGTKKSLPFPLIKTLSLKEFTALEKLRAQTKILDRKRELDDEKTNSNKDKTHLIDTRIDNEKLKSSGSSSSGKIEANGKSKTQTESLEYEGKQKGDLPKSKGKDLNKNVDLYEEASTSNHDSDYSSNTHYFTESGTDGQPFRSVEERGSTYTWPLTQRHRQHGPHEANDCSESSRSSKSSEQRNYSKKGMGIRNSRRSNYEKSFESGSSYTRSGREPASPGFANLLSSRFNSSREYEMESEYYGHNNSLYPKNFAHEAKNIVRRLLKNQGNYFKVMYNFTSNAANEIKGNYRSALANDPREDFVPQSYGGGYDELGGMDYDGTNYYEQEDEDLYMHYGIPPTVPVHSNRTPYLNYNSKERPEDHRFYRSASSDGDAYQEYRNRLVALVSAAERERNNHKRLAHRYQDEYYPNDWKDSHDDYFLMDSADIPPWASAYPIGPLGASWLRSGFHNVKLPYPTSFYKNRSLPNPPYPSHPNFSNRVRYPTYFSSFPSISNLDPTTDEFLVDAGIRLDSKANIGHRSALRDTKLVNFSARSPSSMSKIPIVGKGEEMTTGHSNRLSSGNPMRSRTRFAQKPLRPASGVPQFENQQVKMPPSRGKSLSQENLRSSHRTAGMTVATPVINSAHPSTRSLPHRPTFQMKQSQSRQNSQNELSFSSLPFNLTSQNTSRAGQGSERKKGTTSSPSSRCPSPPGSDQRTGDSRRIVSSSGTEKAVRGKSRPQSSLVAFGSGRGRGSKLPLPTYKK